ncbi:MAG TPA: hypothetical protein VNM91_04515, partial [Dehalococcoidia bacterium]|nr:hypothetical protein [Dehalococcoidia bacterium]
RAAPTPAAPSVAVTQDARPPSATTPPSGTPPAASDETPLAPVELQELALLTIREDEVPFGFRVRSSIPVTRNEVVAGQIAIGRLAAYLEDNGVLGAWAVLYTREQPNSGLSSIAYQFQTAEGARGMVATIASLTTADYTTATAVEPVPAETVGDASVMMRYRLPGARTLELTWSHGNRVGQVLLRYSGDVETPGDRELLLGLARIMQQRIADAAGR